MSDNKTPVAPAPWQKKPTADLPIPPAAPTAEEVAEAKAKAEKEAAETEAKAKAELEHNAALAAAANAAKGETVDAGEPVVMVTVTAPKAFQLRVDDHTVVRYKAGVQEMPLDHADHWFAKANGVEKYER